MLNTDAVKGSEYFNMFEIKSEGIREKLESPHLYVKNMGLESLCDLFGKCYNLHD